MFCEYELSHYSGDLTAERSDREEWNVETADSEPQDISLEEEIHLLRQRMEQIFLEEQSFTSEIVIEISSLLDLKINEYMKAQPKKK
ncbi:aspartyl-phosphate phosphatase Spo0E family protein [Paenibacillus sp. F411]|uniref:Sporulation stage 0, Spo0E-like regulatory phosphatase n=1 Tax=Paenibacillus algicola TaxID=2565926 RepID=A0A4P8XM60_9BACL|nr:MULTISPECIES: aspartyl-phosphate phosphatase Spo0E family protein [Paenibacillus]MBO2943511.1 aspartyl-phosphate phosphatase Spo0E family protein [Paenibacillus sp. F411]QCT03887.1 Sporulation stage 0, Spo0E-like regulatory phosphatase [Paenibacillus algicola]